MTHATVVITAVNKTFVRLYATVKLMNIDELVERSRSKERIDFSQIGCRKLSEPLVKVSTSQRILVEPVWTLKDDFEGGMYVDYIAEHPEYDGIYVRAALLKRLEKVAATLDGRYKLIIRAGHRPLDVQRRLLQDCMRDYKQEHPDASDSEALKHARTFVSDPDISLPPHCCGAAVDVDLFDARTGALVDFGSPANLDEDISYLHYEGISQRQKKNRMLLLRAMLAQGFASTAFEWWHFSCGDQVWAWFYHEQNSLYDLIDL